MGREKIFIINFVVKCIAPNFILSFSIYIWFVKEIILKKKHLIFKNTLHIFFVSAFFYFYRRTSAQVFAFKLLSLRNVQLSFRSCLRKNSLRLQLYSEFSPGYLKNNSIKMFFELVTCKQNTAYRFITNDCSRL